MKAVARGLLLQNRYRVVTKGGLGLGIQNSWKPETEHPISVRGQEGQPSSSERLLEQEEVCLILEQHSPEDLQDFEEAVCCVLCGEITPYTGSRF